MIQKPLGKRKCKHCGVLFQKSTPLQMYCTPQCGYDRAKKLRQEKIDKEERKETRETKEKQMTRNDWIKVLQTIFNTYIRLRDKGLPCISCGTTANVRYDAGHYWPTTYGFLRFNEDNVNRQCSYNCNRQKHGNQVEYRIRLIERIGIERVQWLDDHRQDRLDLSIPELKELVSVYKQKIKELKS